MEMSHNPAQLLLDHQMVNHWCDAVGASASHFFATGLGTIQAYAEQFDFPFHPEYVYGTMVHNARLEHFRKAVLYETMGNLLDIGLNLDDDDRPTVELYNRLVANDHNAKNEPTWLTTPSDSLILQTVVTRG